MSVELVRPASGLKAEETLAAAVDEIRRYARCATLEFTYNVGEIVVRHFFGGDRQRAREGGGREITYRQLAARLDEDLRLSALALWRCVAIHDVMAEAGNWQQWRRISPSHIRAVLPLAPERRHELLQHVETDGVTVRQLEEKVKTGRRAVQRPRDARARVARVVSDLERALARAGTLPDRAHLARSPRTELEELYGRLFKIRERLDSLQRLLSPKALRHTLEQSHSRSLAGDTAQDGVGATTARSEVPQQTIV